MAIIVRRVGDISGKAGNVEFRMRGKTNYISAARAGYRQPNTPEYREKLARFAVMSKFNSKVIKLKELKEIWARQQLNSGVYNFLNSINWEHSAPNDISESAKISADGGFTAPLKSSLLDNGILSVTFFPLSGDAGFTEKIESLIKFEAVLVLTDPHPGNLPAYYMFPIASESINFNLSDSLEFNIKLSTKDSEEPAHYNIRKVFCSLVTLDADGIPVQASKTICFFV